MRKQIIRAFSVFGLIVLGSLLEFGRTSANAITVIIHFISKKYTSLKKNMKSLSDSKTRLFFHKYAQIYEIYPKIVQFYQNWSATGAWSGLDTFNSRKKRVSGPKCYFQNGKKPGLSSQNGILEAVISLLELQ